MKEKQHYLRPLGGRKTTTRHLLLWIEADESLLHLTAERTRAWDMIDDGQQIGVALAGSWCDADGLEGILDNCTKGKGTLTIWLCRGWEDLVLSGLAELIDRNICQWRYAMLDGQRLIVRGLWRGRPVVIASLANWTGSRWNAWTEATEDASCQSFAANIDAALDGEGDRLSYGERLALATWCACNVACTTLHAGQHTPSAAAAALRIWRRWLGPRCTVPAPGKAVKKGKKRSELIEVVAPVPFRPRASALAERHSCYGHLSRQLRRGYVNETIYVLDISAAYLLAICAMPLPLRYRCTLHKPHPHELTQLLADSQGHALVRIQSTDYSYPVRRKHRVFQALGHYWTWLAGHELANALLSDHVRQVQTAYLWHSSAMEATRAGKILTLSERMKARRQPAVAAAWRSIYSSLIGYFASRRKEWVDVRPKPGYERWCEWDVAHTDTGEIVHCRSIAGRHQQLRSRSDTSAAVPLLFACVSSFVHWMVQQLAGCAGIDNVVQMHADSLWVTQPGWQALQRRASQIGCSPDNLKVKAIYDRGWFSGKTVCVVERDGKRYLRTPGLSSAAVIDSTGKVCRPAAVPWSSCDTIDAASGCRRTVAKYPGQAIVDRYGFPAETLSLGEPLDDPLLPEELLKALAKERTVEDE